jgi:hypothetical protein
VKIVPLIDFYEVVVQTGRPLYTCPGLQSMAARKRDYGRVIIGDLFRASLSLLILKTVKSVMATVNFQLVLNELYSILYMRDSW